MKRITWTFGLIVVAGVATAMAQPPAGRGGPGGGGPGGGPGGRPPMPLIDALDSDHDHVISANELKNATASLLTLDKNRDGKLTENEFGPQAGGPGGMRNQNGPGGRGGGNARRGQPGGFEGRGGPGGRPPGGGPDDGPDGGPPSPNPDRMIEHAMEFDADNDGKLSKAELRKFAEDFANHHRGPGGPHGEDGRGPGQNEAEGGQRPGRPD